MQIRIHRDGQDFGPYSLEEVKSYLASGQLVATDLAWYQGAPDWMPITKVPGVAAAPTPAAVVPPAMPAMPAMPSMPAMPAQANSPAGAVSYAGFWKRAAAVILDGFVISAIMIVIAIPVMWGPAQSNKPEVMAGAVLTFYAIYFPVMILYFSLLESGKHQATFGKRAVGIMVTTMDGRRLSFPHALGRWFAKLLNGFTMYIGFMLAGWTEKKQALHDFVAGTLVVNRDPNARGLGGCAIALLVGVVVLIPLTGILAAIAIPAYQDYTLRAKTSGAINQVAPLKVAIAEYSIAKGQLPSSMADLDQSLNGLVSGPIRNVSVSDGTIIITIAATGSPLYGDHVALEPYFNATDNSIVWRCGSAAPPVGANDVSSEDSAALTTVVSRNLPASCR